MVYREVLTLRVKYPPGINTILKSVMAREVIRIIKSRTLRGLDVDGKPFKSYSESYKESKVFERLGKNPNVVNLKLFGDMQSDIRYLGERGGELLIGFGDEREAAKAHGHNNGANNLPVRLFFDLSPSERETLYNKYVKVQEAFDAENLPDLISTRQIEDGESGVQIEVPEAT